MSYQKKNFGPGGQLNQKAPCQGTIDQARAHAFNAQLTTRGVVDEFDWQQWITIRGVSLEKFIMGSDDWLNVAGMAALSARLEIVDMSTGLHMRFETASSTDGHWVDIVDVATTGRATYVFGTEPFSGGSGSTKPIRRYLRWAIQPPATLPGIGYWTITFRIGAARPSTHNGQPLPDFARSIESNAGFGILQPWTTVIGTAAPVGDTELIASDTTWFEAEVDVYAIIEGQASAISPNTDVIVEASMYREGPWTEIFKLNDDTPPTSMLKRTKLTLEGLYSVWLPRYIRWRVASTDTNWFVCFRICGRWA